MRNLLKLCKSIIIQNKGFTICLFLISLLSMIMCFVAANLTSSAEDSINSFIEYSGTPDAIVDTVMMDESKFDFIKSIDEVKQLSTRTIIDINIETKAQEQFGARILSIDENCPYKLEIHDKTTLPNEYTKAMVSYEFADFHNMKVGDCISLITPLGTVDVYIEATVASVETMDSVKDDFSEYEVTQFSYIYMKKNELIKAFGSFIPVNSAFIYFKDGLPIESQKHVLKDIENTLSDKAISSVFVRESKAITKMHEDIDAYKILCLFMPAVILSISLGFSFIFIKIIVENQKSLIALLRALGYSSKKTAFTFIFYNLLINFFAIILALPIGYFLTKTMVAIFVSANGILTTVISISYVLTAGAIILVFAVGVLASYLASRTIIKADPSLAGSDDIDADIPPVVNRINCDPYTKISLVSISRRMSRLVIGFLCIGACIVNMTVGFEGYSSINHTVDAVFSERFKYDLMVRGIDADDYLAVKNNISNLDVIEPLTMFSASVLDTDVKISTISRNSKLLELKNSKNEAIYPADGIIIDEMFSSINSINVGDNITIENVDLKVTGIAREIGCPFFYISPQVAEGVFNKTTNVILLKLHDINKIEQTKKDITNINTDSYFVSRSMQYDYMKKRSAPVRIVMLLFAALAFLIGSLFVFNIAFIDFNEKKNEYATMRALGASVRKISTVSFMENLPRVLFGTVVAIPLSCLFGYFLLKELSMPSLQYVFVNFWECLCMAIAISWLYIVISLFVTKRAVQNMDFRKNLSEME